MCRSSGAMETSSKRLGEGSRDESRPGRARARSPERGTDCDDACDDWCETGCAQPPPLWSRSPPPPPPVAVVVAARSVSRSDLPATFEFQGKEWVSRLAWGARDTNFEELERARGLQKGSFKCVSVATTESETTDT